MSGASRGRLPRPRRHVPEVIACLAVAIAAFAPPSPAAAQQAPDTLRVQLRDVGPGAPGRILRDVLSRPHVVFVPAARLDLPRDSSIATAIVVVGADVTLASRVSGDVVVVGGDLFIRPGADVRGRAIAIGGGVYESMLARIGGGVLAYRDETFEAERLGATLTLSYRALDGDPAARLGWPGLYGLRLPSYSRVDGLAITVGPRVTLADERVELEPRVSYRSHLGAVDPGLVARLSMGRRSTLEVVAERGTYTNDAWSRLDAVNAAATFLFGDDERNYYRATRVQVEIRRRWEGTSESLEPWIGALAEDASSVGPGLGATSAPWSLRGRRDTAYMLRPNPPVADGRITSALAGVRAAWDDGEMAARGTARLEVPADAPADARFAQLTLDASTRFPTVRSHELELAAHAVLTTGDPAPGQRFAYLGGGSTLPTLAELSLGGDQLLFLEGTYLVPLPRPDLPLLGPPTVGLRYAVGSAGVDRLPDFVQNVGLRLILGPVRLDVLVDPASGDRAIGLGYALFR